MAEGAMFGRLQEYREDDWTEFIERLEAYFAANGITGDENKVKQRDILLTVCNSKIYSLMKDLLSPAKPNSKSFKDLVDLVKGHLSPKANEVVERYKFSKTIQSEGESIARYLQSLRKAAEKCNFGANLSERLRDQLVVGVKSATRNKLLQEEELTLDSAVEKAQTMEAAQANAVVFQQSAQTMDGNQVQKQMKFSECFRCGKRNHPQEKCFHRASSHTPTGVSPAELFVKRRLRTRFSLLKPDLRKSISTKQEKYCTQKGQQYVIGDTAIVGDYRATPDK